MSRIDQALEKAAKMRESSTASDRAAVMSISSGKCDPTVFLVPEGGVNIASVDPHIVSITDPASFAAEEYKKLRARIFRATEKDFQNTIMVASALSSEGKTITAINLAVAIAHEFDHTVLLIDADLRKPSIHTYLGLNPQYGLSEYLTSRMALSDILIKTGIGKLVLLPAGKPPKNPAEIIASERMRELVREVKDRYRDRYVIFDSSPLLTAADSLSLCDYVDGVIFVARAEHTSPKDANQALSLIKDCNILGTVFNNVPKAPASDYFSTYYRSEYTKAMKKSAFQIWEGIKSSWKFFYDGTRQFLEKRKRRTAYDCSDKNGTDLKR